VTDDSPSADAVRHARAELAAAEEALVMAPGPFRGRAQRRVALAEAALEDAERTHLESEQRTEASIKRLIEHGPKVAAEQSRRRRRAVLESELRRAEAERAETPTTARTLVGVLDPNAEFVTRSPREIKQDLRRVLDEEARGE
jgi:hypothetical protein